MLSIEKGGVFLRIKWKQLLIAVAIPLAVGGLAALLTSGSMDLFEMVEKPPLSPPGWLFPVVWTILYVLMGVASYLVWQTTGSPRLRQQALRLYAAQLAVNFVWPLLFFNLQWYLFSFLWLVLLWVLVLMTWLSFRRLSPVAGWLLVPYLLWVTFAGYLNLGIYILN